MKNIWLIIIFLVTTLQSQHFDAVSLGMGGNYSALSKGVTALSWNPANLCKTRGNSFELNFFSLNIAAFNNSISLTEYNRYFTQEGHNGKWSESDKKNILDILSDDGIKAYLNATTNILGFAYNNFAFSVQGVLQGSMGLGKNKKLFEIALDGENLTNDYVFNDSKIVALDIFSALKFALGYAYPIEIKEYIPSVNKIYLGLNLNYYMGAAVAQSRTTDAVIKRYLNNEDKEVLEYRLNIAGRTSSVEGGFPAGNGFSIDFGAATVYEKKWLISWSFSDLFGSIHWHQNTEKHVFLKEDSLLTEDLFDANDEDTSVSMDTSFTTSSFNTGLPRRMRLGTAYLLQEDLSLTMDWHQGFDNRYGNSTTPQIGIGTEYYAQRWLPLRAGMSLGGGRGFLFGLGFGIHVPYFQFDYSYAVSNGLWPTYSNGYFTALGMKLNF